MFSVVVRDLLFLIGIAGAYGAGQERSDDEVFLIIGASLLETDGPSEFLSLIPCSGAGATSDEAIRMRSMDRL